MTQFRRLPTIRPGTARAGSRGFSLIELMVSIVIALGMIVTMGVLSTKFETAKREGAASSDMSANAAYLSYDLDRQIRNAGSGFTTASAIAFGCQINASRNSTQLLPLSAALAAPFDKVPLTVRMAPALAYANASSNTATSDVLQIMSGTGGVGEVAAQIPLNSIATNTMRLTTGTGLQANDMLMIAEDGRPCMLEQVTSAYTTNSAQVDLAGTYYASVINGQALNDRSTSAYAYALTMGNASNSNPPKFLLFGINANNQLVRYDLLGFSNSGTNLDQGVPIADNVMDMRVRYGVDTTGVADGIVDAWVTPSDSTYGTTALNTATSQSLLMRVLAIKIDLVLRSDTIEKTPVAPATLTLFSGLASGLQTTYTVADQYRRHMVVEITVPIRNSLANSGRATPS